MYSTGTVTTTANSTKLVGTNTKWLNNINRVSAEQAIQIQIDNTVYNNSIHSIQSDTELTLNFPLPTAATGAKYVILTTMVHSVSDAMNKIVSMNEWCECAVQRHINALDDRAGHYHCDIARPNNSTATHDKRNG
ncbi:hypothetical protein [Providencia sp. PROV113]|uniref:hypothetical protein n=1 Tax=Providencia sp. PROV113 TaxID=2949824 RepID=UPI00234A24E7|nr:hypothetical protein [Providencia sp. PROV113]